MYTKKIPDEHDCGISVAIKVVGGKWKAWIINAISKGHIRPSELHRQLSITSPRIINIHLRELEQYGIIDKIVHPGLPLKVEYFLTDSGKSVLQVIDIMESWGDNNRIRVPDQSLENYQ
ncbi:MAG TPA: helix-turn-helix domain-containing protein [Pedobacter sp.]|uniref:winged helix-turn-helix transcriptional regulator n=1 Tax=Pedobacter sp. TaxID=1411316 RepID=UPI002BF8F18C|nr:helix-turn-helix domain-containing protein [Pedobacter sp.]HMI05430.1 helix-turn-helix domain-containing protein [Pedobacter sp.]